MKYQCSICSEVFHHSSFDRDFKACTHCAAPLRKDYARLQGWAVQQIGQALKDGQLTRPNICELCGEEEYTQAHHANGYDNPLDVWWLCLSCHGRLRGMTYHRGLISRGAAWKIVQLKIKQWPRQRGRYAAT